MNLQKAVAAHLDLRAKPGWELSHFPSGEKRDPITGGRLKLMGLKRGWPDFILISPEGLFHGLELKRKGEELNKFQQGFHDRCFARGIDYAVADNIDEALHYLAVWEVIPDTSRTWTGFPA